MGRGAVECFGEPEGNKLIMVSKSNKQGKLRTGKGSPNLKTLLDRYQLGHLYLTTLYHTESNLDKILYGKGSSSTNVQADITYIMHAPRVQIYRVKQVPQYNTDSNYQFAIEHSIIM